MEITQQIRDYGAEKGIDDAEVVAAGLKEKAGEFREAGGEVYLPAK